MSEPKNTVAAVISSNVKSDRSTKKDIRVITSFVGLEKEYQDFMSSVASKRIDMRVIKGVLHIFPVGKLRDKVNAGLELADKILELSRQRTVIDSELKKYGAELISAWNKTNPAESAQVASVRMVPRFEDHRHSVLVTVKNAYSIKADAIMLLKEELGDKYYELFNEVTTHTVKENESVSKMLFSLLKSNLGEKAVEFFFDTKIEVKMKDSKKYNALLNSDTVSESLKNKLRLACVRSDVSLTYPK